MFYFTIIIIIAMIVFGASWLGDKLSKLILSIYLIWWAGWLSISMFNVYDLFPVSDSIYLLLLLNIGMFYIGFLVSGITKRPNTIYLTFVVEDKFFKRSLYTLTLGLLTVFLFYYWLRFRSVSQFMDPVTARMQRFTIGGVFSSGPELIFFNYFIESFMYIIVIIFAYMIVHGKIRNIAFIFSVICVFLYGGIGSGRGILTDVIIAIVFIYLLKRIEHNRTGSEVLDVVIPKKAKSWTFIFIVITTILAFIYSAWLTALRSGFSEFNIKSIEFGINEFLKQCVVYFTGPFRALEYGLNNYPQSVGLLLGRGTFAGIDEIINMLFKVLGINYQSANEIIGSVLQSNIILVGQHQTFNFAYTNLMIHYFDIGILGIIVFPFFYGFFIRKAIFLYKRRPILPNLILVAFLFNTMINSVFKWGLQSPSSNIAVIGLFIWYQYSYKRLLLKQGKML